ncbi:MAG: cyclic nucleotide-binding domain-containing protein [Deltaproteobacteria bacterium]|uniref:Cyclic nucleotide-binding domain-containing protein n=1 Tax=Candidatus Zymogenus saltonus TaxID=2844893 RepID=A0A9D8PPY6_9DELT|nr:cyclic nucleotide-binding domain-containing protein [Candidatus Zymogenus saltonus]
MSDVKQRATELVKSGELKASKGKYKDAINDYLEVIRLTNSPAIHTKVGECYVKMGQKNEAIKHYNFAAKKYTDTGTLLKAIAVNKIILKIDPNNADVKGRIAELYRKQKGEEPALGLGGGKGVIEAEVVSEPEEPDIMDLIDPDDPQMSEYSLSRKRVMSSYSTKMAGKQEKIELFSDLSRDEFIAVVDKIKPITFSAGEVILREGEEGDSIYCIVSGEVSVSKRSEQGEEVYINSLGEGDFFGEIGFFSNAVRFATIKAVVETTLLELTKRDMDNVVEDHPQVRDVLLNFYKKRILDTILATSPLFSSLSAKKRSVILDLFKPRRFGEGDVVIKQGAPGDSMYFIQSGYVKVVAKKEGGGDFTSRLLPGDFFGEVALITGKPRTADVIAESDLRLLEITRNDLKAVVQRYPEILEILKKNVKSRVEAIK